LLLKTIQLPHFQSIRQTPPREMSTPALPKSIAEEIQRQAGTFITIKKKGILRGYIGTLELKYANLE
jgi:AMMECR1 domain-containing protein